MKTAISVLSAAMLVFGATVALAQGTPGSPGGANTGISGAAPNGTTPGAIGNGLNQSLQPTEPPEGLGYSPLPPTLGVSPDGVGSPTLNPNSALPPAGSSSTTGSGTAGSSTSGTSGSSSGG
jgi:hypothetical protein